MLEHLRQSRPGAAGFQLDGAGWCGGVRVTPQSVCGMCWEPSLISLLNDKAAMLFVLVLLVKNQHKHHHCVLNWRRDQTEVKVKLNSTQRNVCFVPSVVFIHGNKHVLVLTCSAVLMISSNVSATVG